jgi:predicted kinase
MLLDPNNLDAPWVDAMRQCEQSPEYHGEGDVWVHTQLVCSALRGLRAYQAQPNEIQDILLTAAILHDCAKPDVFDVVDGRITSKNHALKGTIKARRILWEAGADFRAREDVCNLVKYHMRPLHLLDASDMESYVAQISLSVRTDLLAILAEADAEGRHCLSDGGESVEKVHIFRKFCQEIGCWGASYPFASDHARVAHFNLGQDIRSQARPPLRPTVIVMSGLPGSGKSHYIHANCDGLPVVSLDAIRESLRVRPADNQSKVIRQAKDEAKRLLGARRDFVWNATNVSKMVRNKCLTLLRQYGARICIVYVETDHDNLWKQNKARKNAVPETVINKLLNKWEVPDLTEAHEVIYV